MFFARCVCLKTLLHAYCCDICCCILNHTHTAIIIATKAMATTIRQLSKIRILRTSSTAIHHIRIWIGIYSHNTHISHGHHNKSDKKSKQKKTKCDWFYWSHFECSGNCCAWDAIASNFGNSSYLFSFSFYVSIFGIREKPHTHEIKW